MHKHAQTVHGPVTASMRSSEQWRFQRIVNDIGNRSLRGERTQRKLERRFAGHAKACRVDDKVSSGKGGIPVAPLDEFNFGELTQCRGKSLAPCRGAVDQPDFRGTGTGQSEHDGAGSAACTQDRHGA